MMSFYFFGYIWLKEVKPTLFMFNSLAEPVVSYLRRFGFLTEEYAGK